MRFRPILMCLIAVALLARPVTMTSQVATGIYGLGTFDSKGFDAINIGNLNAHFEIPVFSKPGRGGMNFSNSLIYDSSIWTPTTVSGSKVWQPATSWGWGPDLSQTGGLYFDSPNEIFCTRNPNTYFYYRHSFIFIDEKGVSHSFGFGPVASRYCSTFPNYIVSGTLPALDNSGLVLVVYDYNDYAIQYPNGQTIVPPYNGSVVSPTTITDRNGNEITSTVSTVTDTTGNVVLTLSGNETPTSPRLLTYPTYVSGAQSTAAVTVNYVSYNVQTAFGCSGISEYSASSVNLVDNIVLADGQTYYFTYEGTPGHSGYVTGRLAQIKLPGGGRIQYSYSDGSNGIICQDGGTATLTRSMPDDPAGSSWTYTRTPGSGGAATSHTIVVDGMSPANYSNYDFVNASPDLTPYVVNYNQYTGAAIGTPTEVVSTCYNGAATCIGQTLAQTSGSALIASLATTTTLNGTSVKKTTQSFNAYGLLTAQTDYDFGSGSPGGQIDSESISYAILGPIVNFPATIAISGNSGAAVQTTTYTYDGGTLTSTSGLPQHVSVPGSRGNLTSVSVATSTSISIQTQTNTYYDTGQLKTSADVLGNSTTYAYDSSTGTFLNTITTPATGSGGSITHSASATYDIPSGVLETLVDQNSNTYTYTFDNMLRPLSTGTSSISSSPLQTYTYSLASTTPYTETSALHSGSSYINYTTNFDAYGRPSETDSTDTPTDDLVKYSYDADGRMSAVSNPYRSGTPAYTQYAYDGLGRTTTITDSDGVSQSTYTYSGNTVILADEASKSRKLVADAAGRLIQVFEPTVGSTSLTLETDYQYDQNQTSGSGSPETYQTIVTQKGGSSSSSDWRVRTFTYDTLGRMVSSVTPEAGTTSYTYPVSGSYCAGNLSLPCSRTDANGTVTTYAYDAQNRLTGKSYSGTAIASNTPSVSYSYDQTSYNGLTISNGKGLLTGMSDGSGATAWSYDALGNTAAVRKTLNSVTKEADYTYNADSTPNYFTDFGGTTFTYTYDVAGHATQIVDGSSNTYAASALYNAAGQLTSLNHQLTSGGAAYVRSWNYNTRLQPSAISATLNSSTFQSLTYGYGTGGTNNGNILSVTNGMDSTRSQSFTYDNLNRLASANDGTHWGETYTIDNWGNLDATTRMSGYSGGNNWSLTAPGSNNQLSNQSYDSAGQVTADQYSNGYSYDAEGRLLSAGSGSYVYDGAGNRVEKTASSTTTLYWPGATSLLNESDSTGSTMLKQVSFAGLLVWSESPSSGGRFLFQDHLGSTRMTGDTSGNLKDDIDYLPFGSVAANYGSSSSNNHYTFTGYESDQSESSTDYAVFRNLNTAMGRFNRPDPYDGSYDFNNPQSFNRYSYVLNNPLGFIDPLGLVVCDSYEVLYDVASSTTYEHCDDDGGGWGNGYSGGGTNGTGGTGRSGGGTVASGSAPSNGPTPNPCQAKLLNMANQQLGTNFNSSNVAGSYINGTAYNIIIQSNQLTAAQFNNIQQGRYTTSGWQYLTGVGLAGHIADETNLGFAQSAFQSSNIGGNLSVSFAFHDDHGYANNPIGALIHWITDVLGHNTRKPC